ncbi:MAG: SurA N-terminal domain-containing protein [Bacteroidaceae bacterium]|nr:SurA N-terminal domain-containing protein [Bacteroidaceae bacterium]
MATLQSLRDRGPLLLIFVGLALLAFIVGDALRLFQSPQGSQAVGSVNGEEVTATQFQQMFEEYSGVIQFARGNAPLSEAENNQLKDQVWNEYLQNEIIKKEAEKLGLTVTDAEILAVVTKGEYPLLQQTPFRNAEGKFDIDILNDFLSQYESNKNVPELVQQLKPAYDYWCFIEKSIKNELLAQKYQSLIASTFLSNPIAAENSFNASNTTYDIEIKAYPYSAIADSTIKISDSDRQKAYDTEKLIYKEPYQSRDIKYVSYTVTPSEQDHAALRSELSEQATLLTQESDYASIVRNAGSETNYSELAWTKSAYPEEVRLRLDSLEVNQVVGPIYNQSDNSYTVFKFLGKSTLPDSVQFRVLPVVTDSPEKIAALADSLLNVLKKGADFKELSAKYGQANNDSLWMTSAMYDGAAPQSDDAAYISAIISGKKGEYNTLTLSNGATLIYQVIGSKNPVTKYNAAVIKRTVEFSNETYNEAYNKFSQYVATCKSIEDLEKNAEEYGFRVMTQNRVFNTTHNIAQISDTRKAIRWIFSEAEVGEVSPLYECGENNNFLVVALTGINEKGYTSMDKLSLIVNNRAKADKKAERIIGELTGKSFDEIGNIAGVKSDVIERISFASPTYVKSISANETVISAAVTKLLPEEVSAPIKGDNGVYVIKLKTVNKGKREFNAESEQAVLKAQGLRNMNYFMSDLIENANIEDNRYLYF